MKLTTESTKKPKHRDEASAVKRIPRASLSINLLTDEDYAVLMDRDDGPEAFGTFVALVVAQAQGRG